MKRTWDDRLFEPIVNVLLPVYIFVIDRLAARRSRPTR